MLARNQAQNDCWKSVWFTDEKVGPVAPSAKSGTGKDIKACWMMTSWCSH